MSRRTLQIAPFAPRTQVIVKTWRGETYDLTAPGQNAFVSWSTRKTTNAAGQFTLILTAVRDAKGRSLAEKILPMDYVEIRAGAQPTSGELPVVMRGFVDSSVETLSFPSVEGGPDRRVVIQGTDFTKLFLISQVQYIWQLNPEAYALALASPFFTSNGLDYIFGTNLLSQSNITLDRYIRTLNEKVLSFFTSRLKKRFRSDLPSLKTRLTVPDAPLVAPTFVESFTGSVWNLYTYYQSPPWGEMFILDLPDAPTLVFRIAPYTDIHGRFPEGLLGNLGEKGRFPELSLSPAEVQSFQVGRTDQSVYNFYFTEGDSNLVQTLSQPFFYTAGIGQGVVVSPEGVNPYGERPSNPILDRKSLDLYGFRSLVEQTPWFSGYIANVKKNGGGQNTDIFQSIQSLAAEMTWWLYRVNKDNAEFLSGTITCHGREDFLVGSYIVTEDITHEGKQIFYIQSVEHTFTQFETWTTTLGVARGRLLS